MSTGARTGFADLPLHGGRVPEWLAGRMARLGRVVVEALVIHYGRAEVLRRLAHPFWFQSLGAVMGMDWHSSGITTSVLGALKRGLAPVSAELGLWVCGGRGRHSRRTPDELRAVAARTGADGDALARTSRLVAKVDSAAVQDGFQLYLHGFVVAADGSWTVVQQGMSAERRQARRYHWLSLGLQSFVDAPHAAIEGAPQGTIVNLADRRAGPSRAAQVELLRAGPGAVLRALPDALGAARARAAAETAAGAAAAAAETAAAAAAPARAPVPVQLALPHLALPDRHEVLARDVVPRRLAAALAAAAERGPQDFPDLLLTPGVGARTLFALAQVAEVVHGAPCRFTDPARFSLAHGGKDGHPFPVPLRVYDETLRVLRRAVDRARLGDGERLDAIRRLDDEARRLEHAAAAAAAGPADVDAFLAAERRRAHAYGGMTVRGPAEPLLPIE